MKCLRCLNTDPRLFFEENGIYYCRRCISFGRLAAGSVPVSIPLQKKVWKGKPALKFELSPFQKEISHQALEILKSGRDVFVFAAAGAGKTEITLESICWYLSQGKKVAFAISRAQVVLEIAKRLQEYFPELHVIAVCQGHTRILDADLIVCTTHQLYRYHKGFDLLVLDELDAYPFRGNPVLEQMAENACIDQKMMLSATPDPKAMAAMEQGKMAMVQLFSRPHGHPLCVPQVKVCSTWRMYALVWKYCRRFVKRGQQVLVFVPRKVDTLWMGSFLGCFFSCGKVHSSSPDKEEVIQAFRDKEKEILVCTTLLERGITIGSVQVIVFHADHTVFSTASLIQIFGRVGRTFQDPEWDGIALCHQKSPSVSECVRQLEWMNRSVSGV